MLEFVKNTLKLEAEAILSIPLVQAVEEAVGILARLEGKLFCTGIGKAGYVARKASSTFSTTGTPSCFLHPGDASHGDIGVVSKRDALMAFSNSGQTREVLETIDFCRKFGISAIVAISSSRNSPMGEICDCTVEIGKVDEACPLGFTPTCSTTAMVAIADALALAAMKAKNFSKEDFALRHHGGYLGIKARRETTKNP